ncbi:MAG: GtrA family protein [Corallococcus sp.]|nr:GtrA family protein [Corallococcus sp.]MCM1359980.1 GtrA family protein [Corallococcus sp.]MCM1395537.1 GtrA family protein [Corallococcus sp.]
MKIKNKELLRTIKYALIAISAGVIQLVSSIVLKLILDQTGLKDHSLFFIKEFGTTTFISDTVGLFLSILWNFTFNRKYTFKAANNVPVAMCLALLFYVPFYPFQIWYIDTIEKALVNIGFWGYVIGLVTCMLINFVLEFTWQRFVVFRKSLDTNNVAQKETQEENSADESRAEPQNGADETETIADTSDKTE